MAGQDEILTTLGTDFSLQFEAATAGVAVFVFAIGYADGVVAILGMALPCFIRVGAGCVELFGELLAAPARVLLFWRTAKDAFDVVGVVFVTAPDKVDVFFIAALAKLFGKFIAASAEIALLILASRQAHNVVAVVGIALEGEILTTAVAEFVLAVQWFAPTAVVALVVLARRQALDVVGVLHGALPGVVGELLVTGGIELFGELLAAAAVVTLLFEAGVDAGDDVGILVVAGPDLVLPADIADVAFEFEAAAAVVLVLG